MTSKYMPRVADGELLSRLRVAGAVVVEGPKACGKTATASRVAKTVIRFDEDEVARSLITLDPAALFTGDPPILFDEWQVETAIWNKVRRQVDDRAERGQFILTGSATPRDDVTRHSGAGRFAVIAMRPMSSFESGHSTGNVSLSALMRGDSQSGEDAGLSYAELLQRIVVGGWPELVAGGVDEDFARDWLDDYLEQIVHVDVVSLGHRRSPRNLRRLLASLARGVGQAVKLKELASDVGGEPGPVATETVNNYLDALDRLKLTDNSPAWQPHMRSKTRLRAAPVRYFVDPSLGPAALGIGSAQLRADPRAAGFHFEALVHRDLRCYADPLRGRVESWRDVNGNEVDAIVTLRDGSWGAFEVKVNPRDVDVAAAGLLNFSAKVDTEKHGTPAVLGVITGTGHAGVRSDGVHVIPIGALGP